MHNEVLNDVNTLTLIHCNIFEAHKDNNADQSLTSTSVTSSL